MMEYISFPLLPMSLTQVHILVESTRQQRENARRDHLILRLLSEADFYGREVCRLRWCDIKPHPPDEFGNYGDIEVYSRKGNIINSIPVGKSLWRELMAWRRRQVKKCGSSFSEEEYIFLSRKGGKLDYSSIWRIVKRAANGVEGLSPSCSPLWLRVAYKRYVVIAHIEGREVGVPAWVR